MILEVLSRRAGIHVTRARSHMFVFVSSASAVSIIGLQDQ